MQKKDIKLNSTVYRIDGYPSYAQVTGYNDRGDARLLAVDPMTLMPDNPPRTSVARTRQVLREHDVAEYVEKKRARDEMLARQKSDTEETLKLATAILAKLGYALVEDRYGFVYTEGCDDASVKSRMYELELRLPALRRLAVALNIEIGEG